MKFRITFKDPDGVWEDVSAAVKEDIQDKVTGLDPAEIEDLFDARREEVNKKLVHWIQWGEYVTIEFDLDTHTATVVSQ